MALPIQVTAYSGYRANEYPCSFIVDEQLYIVQEVLQRWYEPSLSFFKVLTTDGKAFVLRYKESIDEWSLTSRFDGAELMGRPSIKLIAVDAMTIQKAERLMESCDQCHPDEAHIPFDWLLAEVTGKHGQYDFVMAELGRCPNCNQPVTESTLIEPRD
jgi:hypothetical protein